MNADAHVEKAERFEAAQAKLAPATDWELIIEGCHMAAHNYIVAGAEWGGVPHPSNHAHAANAGLLLRSGAPAEVQRAWREMDGQRSGRVYGKQPNGVQSGEVRDRLRQIKDWATAARP